jgi:hypothetical protein
MWTLEAHLAKFYLELSNWYYQNANRVELPGEFHEVVKKIDDCLAYHEQHKFFMAELGLSVSPEQEKIIESAISIRERYVQAQKEKEDNESLQRIKAFFAQP